MDIQEIILNKVESIETKVDNHTEAIHCLRVETIEAQNRCKVDCNKQITKVRFGLLKLLALVATGSLTGASLSQIIKLF